MRILKSFLYYITSEEGFLLLYPNNAFRDETLSVFPGSLSSVGGYDSFSVLVQLVPLVLLWLGELQFFRLRRKEAFQFYCSSSTFFTCLYWLGNQKKEKQSKHLKSENPLPSVDHLVTLPWGQWRAKGSVTWP